MSLPETYNGRNILLRSLPAAEFSRLAPHLERTAMKLRQSLFEPDRPIERVYFPENIVASIVSSAAADAIEVGLFGHEGMSGAPVVLGAGQSPHRSMVQVDGGSALHIDAARLADACAESGALRGLLLRDAHTLALQAAHTAAANARFELPVRLARWLLMCHDRVEGDEIGLTHEFMGMMLGVRRSGVTVTLHALEGGGAVRARRGCVTVADRGRLEQVAGESFGRTEAEYRRLIGPFGKSGGGG